VTPEVPPPARAGLVARLAAHSAVLVIPFADAREGEWGRTAAAEIARAAVRHGRPAVLVEIGTPRPDRPGVPRTRGGLEPIIAGDVSPAAALRRVQRNPSLSPGTLALLYVQDGEGHIGEIPPDVTAAIALTRQAGEVKATRSWRHVPVLAAVAPRAAPSMDERLRAMLRESWKRYRPDAIARARDIGAAAQALARGELPDAQRRMAERQAHKLAGSAGTFGFPEVSRLAREAEHILSTGQAIDAAEALRLSGISERIGRELRDEPVLPSRPRGAAPIGPAGTRVLLLDIPADAAGDWRVHLSADGMTPVFAGRDEARTLAGKLNPAAVVVNGSGPLEVVSWLAARVPPVPCVVLGASNTLTDRLAAARHGAERYLSPPARPRDAARVVVDLLRPAGVREGVVLAVDDDDAVLHAVRAVLADSGLQVETLRDPLGFWAALDRIRPDVVLLDLDMPSVSGIELCRAMRGDPRWQATAVMFLAGSAGKDTIHRVFATGADDFVAKPIVGPELAARVHNRLERVRLLGARNTGSGHEELADRESVTADVTRMLRLAEAREQPFAFAIVEAAPDAPAASLAGVGRRLRKHLRPEDVLGRWTRAQLAVVMYGMDKASGVQRLLKALEAVGDEAGAVRAGVAVFPADGTDVSALERAARGAAASAVPGGADRVCGVGWVPGRSDSQAVDVLVVEDDPVIARLLAHAIDAEGLSCRVVTDGVTAVEQLTGVPPALAARTVLLDVDLPGLDGHAVLRRLGEARLLGTTRVIMLTVRSNEAEIVRAMRLGAFDHVAKPFSLPVLLQRLRLALGR
jgi:DNA-binding response OmpR family regulator